MQLRLRNLDDVRKFAVSITIVAMLGNVALQHVILPQGLFHQVLFSSVVVTVCLALPISYYVGLKILDIHELTVRLEHAVNHDALTDTYSRTRFYEHVRRADGWPMMLIAADIDHFKRVNDTFGHQAGDKALKQFAATLIRNCREDDVVARFGGEEFIILLRADLLDEAVATAERLCEKVRAKKIVLNETVMSVTASFGVARVERAEQIDAAIHRADLALYRAKSGGRDQVCVYDPEVDQSRAPDKGMGLYAAALPKLA